MSDKKKCCKTCPPGPMGPRGVKGDPGEITFLKSNFVAVNDVELPASAVDVVIASLLVGNALSPARLLNVFSALSVLATQGTNLNPASARFQLRVDGVIQPNIARVTIDAPGGDSGSLLALVPVGTGAKLVELLGTNQVVTATFLVNAALLVQETTV